jgi:uncharacterized C2H2 Zn-finger protein
MSDPSLGQDVGDLNPGLIYDRLVAEQSRLAQLLELVSEPSFATELIQIGPSIALNLAILSGQYHEAVNQHRVTETLRFPLHQGAPLDDPLADPLNARIDKTGSHEEDEFNPGISEDPGMTGLLALSVLERVPDGRTSSLPVKYRCPRCGKSYKYDKAQHLSKCPGYPKKSVEKTFFCPLCPVSYARQKWLKKHLEKVHKTQSYALVPTEEMSLGDSGGDAGAESPHLVLSISSWKAQVHGSPQSPSSSRIDFGPMRDPSFDWEMSLLGEADMSVERERK